MFILLLTLIFIRPFISSLAFPYLNTVYSATLLIFLLVWLLRRGLPLEKITFIRLPLILFILALLISLVFSTNKMVSLKELYKYISGVMLLLVGASLATEDRNKVIQCLVWASFAIGILAIYQYFFGFKHLLAYMSQQGINDQFALDYISQKRIFFPFATPNILGGYLAMMLPLAFTQKKKYLFIIPIVIALFLTKSLGAFLALGTVCLFYLLITKKLNKKILLFFFVLITLAVAVLILRLMTQKQHFHPAFSALMRLDYWKETWKIILTHPLTGLGIGNFSLPTSRYAHNSYLQIWAEMGILGIVAILWFVIYTLKFCWLNIRSSSNNKQILVLSVANVIFLAHNAIDFSFFTPEISLLWWVLIGMCLDT